MMYYPQTARNRETGFSLFIVILIVVLIIGFVAAIRFLVTNRPTQTSISKSQNVLRENYYKKFQGPSGRFSFEYPAKWKLIKDEEKGEYIFSFPEDFVTVFIEERSYTIQEGSIEKNFSRSLEQQKEELASKGYSHFTQQQYKRDDMFFFRLNYDLTPVDNINRKGVFLYIVKNNTFYSVNMAVVESKYDQMISDFEHLIQSFR